MADDRDTRPDPEVAPGAAPGAEQAFDTGATEAEGGSSVAALALAGLTVARKTLPPSLFYDEEGCRLFYRITELPEYYLTRTEFRLLESVAGEAAASVPAGATLVEYGASDETKAGMLLRHKDAAGASLFRAYVPIDIAGPALRAMRRRMAGSHPGLTVLPVTADFMRPVLLPARPEETAVMGFFPGSTIGNLEPSAAIGFLSRAREALGPGARFLLGFDNCRDPARLVPAYDDAQGVTASFNLNLLRRLNREAGGDFDLDAFAHRAVWNTKESRIEMHLVSPRAASYRLAGQTVRFAPGETIHTENSYKYPPERMEAMVAAAGWTRRQVWLDPQGLFAIWLLD